LRRQDTPETHNATRLNNAWWRWFKSGQRNPPVTICRRRPCQGSLKSATSMRQCGRKERAATSRWGPEVRRRR